MKNSQRQITVNHPAVSPPETVQELLDNLALFPPDYQISFAPFTLFRIKDRGGEAHFEFNEAPGVDYTLRGPNRR